MLYPEYRVWPTQEFRNVDGVVVACDVALEWILPWWWGHYSKHNSHPVVFVDYGLSKHAKEWCLERGELIPLRVADVFVAKREDVAPHLVEKWESEFGNRFWRCRDGQFKKPLACLRSPFRRSLWLDLDCEVRGSIALVFDFAEHPSGLALYPQRRSEERYTMYNSGVVSFKHGCLLLETWADGCFENNHLFVGDQEILAHILFEQKTEIGELPNEMNWSRCHGKNPNILIYHRHGLVGHNLIRQEISLQNEFLKQW